MPLMQRLSTMEEMRCGCDGIALHDSLYMAAADIDAHTYLVRAQRHRADTGKVLGKRQRGTATKKSEHLTILLVHLHLRLTGVGLGG